MSYLNTEYTITNGEWENGDNSISRNLAVMQASRRPPDYVDFRSSVHVFSEDRINVSTSVSFS
jgi:hypothetical protein